jgi:hypothetical protein
MGRLLYNLNFWSEYLTNSLDSRIPSCQQIEKALKEINYYCKIKYPFDLDNVIKLKDIDLLKSSGYSYDFYRILYPFKNRIKFHYLFGDITEIPKVPTFVKSRPISECNENAVLLPLDSCRHFNFIRDRKKFSEKKEKAVWRGAAYQRHRLQFLESCQHLSFLDIGNTAVSKERELICAKAKMSIRDQLDFKFIISLEGNDVATNLKWIMSSNSVCIMPRPKYETWFMEGKLKAGVHYIEILDDFSNLEEQFLKYLSQPSACEEIILNANKYTKNFSSKHERLLKARMVSMKFMNLTNA